MTPDPLDRMAAWADTWTLPRGVEVASVAVRRPPGVLVVTLVYLGVRRVELYSTPLTKQGFWLVLADDAMGLVEMLDRGWKAVPTLRARRVDFQLSTTGLGGDGA